MANTLPNIELPKRTWIDLYSESGISAGTSILIENLTQYPVKIHIGPTSPSGAEKEDQTGSFIRAMGYLTKSSESGESGLWAYSDTIDGLLNVSVAPPTAASNGASSIEYGLNIQRGLVPGVGIVHIFGRNPDIDTADGFKDIWNGGPLHDEYTAFNATGAEVVTVVSTSTDDVNITGTGAWLIQLVGLDGSYNEVNEILALNGTTPVVSTQAFIRCRVAIILTAGTDAHNVGEITCRQSISTDNIFFEMPETANRTLICAYTVPAGKVAYVTGGFATLAKKGNASSEIKVSVRYPGSVFQVVEWFAIDGAGSSYVNRDFEIPLNGIPTGTDIRVQANTDTNNTGVAAGLEILTVEV